MSYPYLLPLAQASDSRRRVGVKVARLAHVQRELRDEAKLALSWVLEVEPFRQVLEAELPSGHDPKSLLKTSKERTRLERAARARERILDAKLPEDLEQALTNWLNEVLPNAPWGIAVRTSPTCDSQVTATLAGLSDVQLGVRTPEALFEAIKAMWSAVFFPRTLEALIEEGVKDVAMAVLLQPVIHAHASGTLITRPPPGLQVPSWRLGDRMIRARFGLGSPCSRPEPASDLLCVTRGGVETIRVIARKASRIEIQDDGPTCVS
ncbi:MAG: PEP/pyruvate-binding domain-containing protein [Polyangiaceae bacterium]